MVVCSSIRLTSDTLRPTALASVRLVGGLLSQAQAICISMIIAATLLPNFVLMNLSLVPLVLLLNTMQAHHLRKGTAASVVSECRQCRGGFVPKYLGLASLVPLLNMVQGHHSTHA